MSDGFHFHKYAEAPVAGWQGYLENEQGKVVAWVGSDEEVVPHSDIVDPP